MGEIVQFESAGTVFRLRELISGKGVITRWLAKEHGARARFRIRVRDLRRIPRADWTKKQFNGLGDDVYEIKWEFGKKQWRALGFDSKGYFVMVLGCTHKDDVYDPVECLHTAKRRKKEAERGEWGIADYEP
jgi:phage-related protein